MRALSLAPSAQNKEFEIQRLEQRIYKLKGAVARIKARHRHPIPPPSSPRDFES